jgi:acyl-homoserine lactone acylase PvdQ
MRGAYALALTGSVLGIAGCGNSTSLTDEGGSTPPIGPAGESIFLQVVPPGANGNSAGGIGGPLPQIPTLQYPPNYRDQLDLYGNLAYAKVGLKGDTCNPPASIDQHQQQSDQACNYFSDAGFVPKSVTSSVELTAPHGKKVTIQRDGWGVPYIDGEDRAAAEYGMGYAAAADRLWLFDVLRRAGRGRVSEFLGPASTTYDLDLQFGGAGGYSEDELTDLVNAAVSKITPTLGGMFLADVQNFVAGMNAYIAFLQTPAGLLSTPPEYLTLALQVPPVYPPAPFTVNDIVANAVLIQAQFGRGGGGEATNLDLLQKLDPGITAGTTQIPQAACALWRDLRHASDPGAAYTADEVFNTQSPPTVDETCPQNLPAGVAIWDVGSLRGREFLHRAGNPLALPILAPITGLLGGLPGLSGAAKSASADDLPRPPLKAAGGVSMLASADPTDAMHVALNKIGLPKTSSNWIGVNADQTRDGHPIIVAGPQTSYYMPQLLWEASVMSHGGTPYEIAARGITTVNLPYIVIGHGLDFGWSATSAGSDLIDTRVSKMCNMDGSPTSRDDGNGDGFPDADGYIYKGDCVRFYKRVDQWLAPPTLASIALGGPTTGEDVSRYILRTHYGPVTATATVDGEPVAISEQRSTFFGDVDTTAPFALLTTTGLKMNHSIFKQLFNSMTSTFNWIYADSHDLAFIQSGLYPQRHPGQQPELPVWGDGNFEWVADQNLPAGFFEQYGGDGNNGARSFPSRAVPVVQGDALKGYFEWPGYLPLAAHIQGTNPSKGYFANWNNAGAPGWWAADSNGTFGPTHRMRMLEARLVAMKAAGRKHDVGTMIESMADAGYTDLRGQDVLPLLLQIMQTGELSADQQTVVDLMQQWIDAGSNNWISNTPGLGSLRRDRDANGAYDMRAQVVLMDAWYPHLIDALLPQLVEVESTGASVLQARYDAPRAQGSAYQEGWYEHMKRVLEMVLGTPGHFDYRVLKCADGTLQGCRAGVLAALDQALGDLGGLGNQAGWDGTQLTYAKGAGCGAVEACDAVVHTSFSFIPVPDIHWVNRPTFQQVTQVRQDRNGQP